VKKWPSKGLILECKNCKEKIQDFLRTSYCTCQVISLKSDFFIQKEVIEELIEKADYKYIFYPKFYCELNFIERYWRAYKRYI